MNKYALTHEEDSRLRFSIMLPGRRGSLYQYLCQLPLTCLQAYPEKGYRPWMGQASKTPQALAMRDYILHWRFIAQDFRKQYPRACLETLSVDELQSFFNTYFHKVPSWAYQGPLQDAAQLIFLYTNAPPILHC